MGEWQVHVRTEWKLLRRGPYLWTLLLLSFGLGWLVYQSNADAVNFGHHVQQFSFLYIAPLSMIAVLAGVHAARRDRAFKTDRIVDSMPYRSGTMVTVRFAMTALPYVFVAFAPFGLLLYYWAVPLGGNGDIGYSLAASALMPLGMAYAVVLGWWAGTPFAGRVAYLAGFVVWFVHFYLILFLNQKLPAAVYALPSMMLADYKSLGFWDDMWGMLRDATFWLHRGMYAALTALLCLLLVFRSAKRRREPVSYARFAAAFLLCTAVATGSLVSYASIRGERAADFLALQKKAEAAAARPAAAKPAYRVDRYDLQLRYAGPETEVKADMVLELTGPAAPKELLFTLNESFDVKAAVVNGQAVTASREGDWVGVPVNAVPGSSITVSLQYGGAIRDWRVARPYGGNAGNMVVPTYFAAEKQVFLPGSYGWYPIPGEQTLVLKGLPPNEKFTEVRNHYPNPGFSAYRLTVDYPDGVRLFSNLTEVKRETRDGRQLVTYEQQKADGCTLVGGALKEAAQGQGNDQVRAVFSQMVEDGYADHLLRTIRPYKAEIDRILGLPSPSPLTLLPIDSAKGAALGDAGGVLTIGGNSFLFEQDDAEYRRTFLDAYVEKWTGQNGNGPLLNWALGVHLQNKAGNKPPNDDGTWSPDMKLFLDYTRIHTQEETETLLRQMYVHLRDQPEEWLRLDRLLGKS